jgi:predicted transcriptional regulator
MDNIIAISASNLSDVAVQIAARVKDRRLELDLTQEGLAARAASSLRRIAGLSKRAVFISGLLQIGFALNALSEFDALFSQKQYKSWMMY